MNSLVMINNKDNDLRAYYDLSEVDNIKFGKMKDFYDECNILGNGYKANDLCVIIYFYDGSVASFKADDWRIEYRTY